MRLRSQMYSLPVTMENRYTYACLTSPNDADCEMAWGYKDAYDFIECWYMSEEDLQKHIEELEMKCEDEYDKGYLQCFIDYQKEKKQNEHI